MISNFAAFLGVSILVIVSPGQDTALTIRNTLVGGRSGGIATAAGVVTGLASWTVASSAGLAALLVASQPLFLAIRLVGAAYLVFLGLQAVHAAIFSRASRVSPSLLRGANVVRVAGFPAWAGWGSIDRAPLLVVAPPGHATRTTQARWTAAPPAPRLLLLPSGPDRVHGTRSRRTRPSTQSHETPLRTAHPSKGNSTPLKRIAGTGHRWLPV
jgi:LysE type translocator